MIWFIIIMAIIACMFGIFWSIFIEPEDSTGPM